jgi:hypothetical protein
MSADIEAWPPPSDPVAFESLCLDLWKELWADPGAQKSGRSGQFQRGVDVFGRFDGKHVGVQCKQKDGLLRTKLTVRELEEVAEEARTFQPPLTTLIIATTGPRDVNVQQRARTLSEANRHSGLFSIEVWSWDDIWHALYQHQELLKRLAPNYWPRIVALPPPHRAPRLAIALIIALLGSAVFIAVHFRLSSPPGGGPSAPEKSAWQPPELPPNCSNVLISLGGLTMNLPIILALVPSEPSSAQFLMRDLPPELTRDVDKLTNYSPRIRRLWLRRQSMEYTIGGKKIEFPIAPLVRSNRLYIQVDVPFQNTKRTILMSDDFDPELSPVPRLWDRNYCSNCFELVNEHTNPVLQVIYKRPNEVQVNGIFLVDTYDLLVSFGALPVLLSPQLAFYDNQSTQMVDPRVLSKVSSNLAVSVDTNAAYGIPFPDQKPIFKYPSWKYPGVLAAAPNAPKQQPHHER